MPGGGAESAAAEGGLGGTVLGFLKELASPEMMRALSPTEGIKVNAHVFNSVEQEGRWKGDKEANPERRLLPAQLAKADAPKPTTYQAKPITGHTVGKPGRYTATVLTIDITGQKATGAEKAAQAGFPSTATIDVHWWADDFEIWAGVADLGGAVGFTSEIGHVAGVTLGGVPFGNYFPTSYFLFFSGFINPVGPAFYEFRGAIVVKADGLVDPMFCEKWSRDEGGEPDEVGGYDRDDGYRIEI